MRAITESHGKAGVIVKGAFALAVISGFATKLAYTLNRSLDGDDVLPALYLYDIFEYKNYLLKGWQFVGDNLFFIDFPFYLVAALIGGISPFVLKVVAFVIFLLGVLSLCFVLWRYWGGLPAAIGGVSLLALSSFGTRIVTKPYIHAGTIALSFVMLSLALAALDEKTQSRRRHFRKTALLVALSVLSVTSVFSDPYLFFVFTVPFIVTMAASQILGVENRAWKDKVVLAAVLFVSALAGLALQRVATAFGFPVHSSVDLSFARLSMLPKNAVLYLQCLLALFDADVFSAGLSTPAFIVRLGKLLFAVFMIVGVIAVFRRERDGIRRITILFFVNLALLLSAAYVFSTKPLDLWTARFLTPLLYVVAFLAGLFIATIYDARSRVMKVVVTIVFFAVSFHNIYETYLGRNIVQAHGDLASYLESEGLEYGYSDYWTSNLITTLTDNRLPVRFVYYASGLIVPFPLLTNFTWYEPDFFGGPTFLMVPKSPAGMGGFELPQLTARKLENNYGKPTKVLAAHGMTIFVWPYNIMDVRPRVSVEFSEAIPHQAGKLETFEESLMLHASQGDRGFLLLGPYWPLSPGRYRATFSLAAKGPADSVGGRVDVSRINGPSLVGTQKDFANDARGEWQDYQIDFAVEELDFRSRYEFRVFVGGTGDVKVRSVVLETL